MAGDVTEPGQVRLSPRRSFQIWTREVFGRCRPWLAAEIDTARALARAIPDLQLARARAHMRRLADLAQLEADARSAVEAAARENQNHLQELAGSTAVGMFVRGIDPPDFVYINPGFRNLLGLEAAAEDPGLDDFLASVDPDDRPRARALMTARANAPTSVDVRLVVTDRPTRWIRLTSNPVTDGDRTTTRSGTIEDVTDHKAAETALQVAQREAEQANAARQEFISRMSHELRTPLNAVLGFWQLLELGQLSTSQEAAVGHILGGGRHLLAMINNILQINGNDADADAMSLESVRVEDIIAEALALIRPVAVTRGIRIDFPPDQPAANNHVIADRRRLRQVLLNLLDNAIKFNTPDGRVDVAVTAAKGDRVAISIIDTGLGIPAEDLPRLFQPFDRLGRQTLGVEGSGLGLAQAQRLAASMHGLLDVESTSGRSSTFTLTMPSVATPDANDTRSAADPTGES